MQFRFIIPAVFSNFDFPILSPTVIFRFFLSQTACWQDFLCIYTPLCAGISEDGMTQCGEARASLF